MIGEQVLLDCVWVATKAYKELTVRLILQLAARLRVRTIAFN
jgi:hypothetical protein